MQIYYFSDFLNNLVGGHLEIFSAIGLFVTITGMYLFILGESQRWIIVVFIGMFFIMPGIIWPNINENNIINSNVINKPFELISDQDDAFLYIKTYEVDSNKKQVYIESKVYSFHKSLEIENVDGKNIIKREN
jgi:hypothetical protein